jgi:hypothetical protein
MEPLQRHQLGRNHSIITTKAKFSNRKPRSREWRGLQVKYRTVTFGRLSARVERQSHTERFLSRGAFGTL